MANLQNADPELTCRRCGTCCLKGGPALHAADLPLLENGTLPLALVLTLRAGEPVFDQVRGEVRPLAAEILKIKGPTQEDPSWACELYDRAAHACALYADRPAECRALFCADTSKLAAMYERDRLTRRDLLPAGHGALAVMAEHEALVPAGRIAPLAEALRKGGAAGREAGAELERMALADQAFRKGLAERMGIGPELHEFFLGRDARALFAAAGVTLRPDVRTGLRVQPDPLWRHR